MMGILRVMLGNTSLVRMKKIEIYGQIQTWNQMSLVIASYIIFFTKVKNNLYNIRKHQLRISSLTSNTKMLLEYNLNLNHVFYIRNNNFIQHTNTSCIRFSKMEYTDDALM